tara:strand:- start:131 stop:691 length:561 start_codon:yes stop_codon:yes gene_type:complete
MTERYENGKIYRLFVPGNDECYVGSTIWQLRKRLDAHKYAYYNPSQKQTTASLLFGLGEVNIELLEAYPCNTIQELKAKEREWIEKTPNAINKNIPGRTMEEERETNKEKYAQKCKEWREANKERVAEYDAKYKAEHKEQSALQRAKWAKANKDKIKANKQMVITCSVCKEETTKGNKWRHDKTHK